MSAELVPASPDAGDAGFFVRSSMEPRVSCEEERRRASVFIADRRTRGSIYLRTH